MLDSFCPAFVDCRTHPPVAAKFTNWQRATEDGRIGNGETKSVGVLTQKEWKDECKILKGQKTTTTLIMSTSRGVVSRQPSFSTDTQSKNNGTVNSRPDRGFVFERCD